MLFVELTLLTDDDKDAKISVNPVIVTSYFPCNGHCQINLAYGPVLSVKESYEKVNKIMQHFEMINNDDILSLHIGIRQYLDFLSHTKQNPLRDEYLKWKGRHQLISGKQWIDADELLIRLKPDEKTRELIESLIVKDDENEND